VRRAQGQLSATIKENCGRTKLQLRATKVWMLRAQSRPWPSANAALTGGSNRSSCLPVMSIEDSLRQASVERLN